MTNVYNISNGADFLSTLALHILKQGFSTDDIIILPSRRACRTFKYKLLEHSSSNSILLPQILTYADIPDSLVSFLKFAPDLNVNILPAISNTALELLLLEIVKEVKFDYQNTETIKNFIVELYTFCESAEKLENQSLSKIIQKLSDTLETKQLLLEQQRRNIAASRITNSWQPCNAKIHAIIPTSNVPYIRRLISFLHDKPNASLYLQGVDTELPQTIWNAIDNKHPQYFIKDVLDKLNVDRSKLQNLSNNEELKDLSQIMYPSHFIDTWRDCTIDTPPSEIIECEDQAEEMNIISYIIREAIENLDEEIALITQDRNLAYKVKQQLKVWDININDTVEEPLNNSELIQFFMLILDFAWNPISSIKLLEVLKHPICNFSTTKLEVKYLRQPQTWTSIKELIGLIDEEDSDIKTTLDSFEQIISFLYLSSPAPVNKFLKNHSFCFEKLINKELLLTPAGIEFQKFKNEILSSNFSSLEISKNEYQNLIRQVLTGHTYRENEKIISRISILTPIEARLHKFDKAIVAGLNEGSFPQKTEENYIISKSGKESLGFVPKDENIGYLAHDFVSLCHNTKVILTRSKKIENAEQEPSRFLNRMQTYLALIGYVSKESKYRRWYEKLKSDYEYQPIQRPYPQPESSIRPRKLSVSAIEKLMRDPYAYYAQYILKLSKLDPVGNRISSKDFGIILHNVLARIKQNFPDNQKDYLQKFQEYYKAELGKLQNIPETEALWNTKLIKIAKWFWDYEKKAKQNLEQSHTEINGALAVAAGSERAIITARADRIDINKDGSFKVIDYKTGYSPTIKDINFGLYPQLPIEALMITSGGFSDIDNRSNEHQLQYIELKGKKDIAAEKSITTDLDNAKDGLNELIEKFILKTSSYFASANDDQSLKTLDYKHLSRKDEWFDQA